MSVTQTVEIPADRRLILDVPGEVPTGSVVLTFTPAATEKDKAPVSGRAERYNGQTITQKINEIYGKIDSGELDRYLDAGLEPTRNLTKNDSW